MHQPDSPQTSGRSNVPAARKSPLARTIALLPRLRDWARVAHPEGVNVAKVSSAYGEDWLGSLAPLAWETAAPTLPVGPTTLNLTAEGIGRLDGAFHRAFEFEPIAAAGGRTAVLGQSGEFVEELAVFADQRRAGLDRAARLPGGHPYRSLIPASRVDAAISSPAATVVWSMEPGHVRIDAETGDPWLLGCGVAPSHGPFGANLADVVSRLGHHRLTYPALREAVTHYNRGLTTVLGDAAPHLSPAKFAVLLEAAATGPVGSEAGETAHWAVVRPYEFEILVPLGLKHMSATGEPS
ncbi:hypothetical protein [Embleya sp. AB8]|uniref:hypothetical protein n=1 Tax=Embleya sp. AB8 TaxID=3156304 RepID=UPI003C73971B